MASPRARLAGWAELGLLVVVGVFALWFNASLKSRLPKEGDYLSLAAHLQERAQPGDVVLLYPWWTERARLFFPPTLPIVGYWGSDTDALRGFARIWVLSQPRLPRSDWTAFEKAFLRGRVPENDPRWAGNLKLALYRNDLYRPRKFEAATAYATAAVYLQTPGGARVVCPFDGNAHQCPGGGQLHVSPEWHEIFYRPLRCLWMHPPGGETRLVAEFHSVPIDHWLRLEGGIIWEYAVRHESGLTPVRIGVDDAKGATLLELRIAPGSEGMQKAETTLPPDGGSTIGLKLWVQSDNATSRETCVNLFSEGKAAAEAR